MKRVIERLRELYSFIREAVGLLMDPEHRGALKHITDVIKRLCKRLSPKEASGYVRFGTGDPYDTGRVMEAAAFLYPFYGDRIEVIPVFDEAALESRLSLKGRFRLYQAAFPLIGLLLDKEVRTFIREALSLRDEL